MFKTNSSTCKRHIGLSVMCQGRPVCVDRAVRERTTSAGWRHDTSRFGGLCCCSLLRRALPACSRAEQTALGTQSGCAPRWRPGLRSPASKGGQGRSFEAGSASAWTTCLKQGSACRKVVVMFVLLESKYYLRPCFDSPRKEAGGGPQSPRPGSWPDMEAGQRVRSSGIPRPPPSRNGASQLTMDRLSSAQGA